MKAIRIILSSIRKADDKYNLINEGDKIALGISGGKDSMLLLYALSLYQQYSKISFEIIPFTIDLGFPGYNTDGISKFVAKLHLNLEIIDSRNVYKILTKQQELQKLSHLPCSICSKMKKASIIKSAKSLGCNKVAFAHHADDAIETLFLNEIYGGRIATFEPKMFLSREEIYFIRPLILCRESDIKRCVKEQEIPSFSSCCPVDGKTRREDMKELLNEIYKQYPESKSNFLRMIQNYDQLDIFTDQEENKILHRNGYYYKKIIAVSDFADSINFLKSKKKAIKFNREKYLDSNQIYYSLYNPNNEIEATISMKINEKDYEITSYKYKTYDVFEDFILTLYFDLYKKLNPYQLYISSDQDNFLKRIGFSKFSENKYVNISNPIKIINSLKN